MAEHPPPVAVPVTFSGPGELRRVMLEDLEDDALQGQLGRLAQRWQMAAVSRPDDARARAVNYILWALYQREFDKLRKWDGQARDWLEKHNRGPRSRPQEAERLSGAVAGGDPDTVLGCLETSPLLNVHTVVRSAPVPWPETERDAALETIRQALNDHQGEPPEAVAKAVMRALGCPKGKARNMFAHLDVKAKRP